MTNTAAQRVESRSKRNNTLIRGAVTAVVLGAALASFAAPAAAQSTVTERTVSELSVAETADGDGPGHELILGGSLMLTAGYVSSFAVGLGEGSTRFMGPTLNRSQRWYEDFTFTSFIPLAGPWIALSERQGEFDQDYWGVWLIANGLLQAAGFGMIVSGIIVAAQDSHGQRRTRARISQPSLQVIPSVGVNHAGLSLAGSF